MRRHVTLAFEFLFALLLAIGLRLPDLCAQVPDPPQLQYWAGHEAPLYAVAYSPDGKNVISASVDGSLRVWDRATGTSIRKIVAHQGPALTLAVAPDGLTFASGGRDGKVRWFELPRWQSLADIPGVPGVPSALAVGIDSPFVLTGDAANIVRLWDANTKAVVRDFGGAVGGVTGVALNVSAKQVIAASGDGIVRVWNLDNAQLAGALTIGPSPAMTLSPDGKSLALGGQDGLLRLALWPPMPPLTLATHNDQSIATTLVANGQLAVSAGLDAQVHLIQTADGKLVRSLVGQPSKPTSVAANRDATLVATGSDTGIIKLWLAADGADRGILAGHVGAITSLAWDPQQDRLATAGTDGTIRIWTPPTPAKKWGAHGTAADRIVTSANSPVAASIGTDKTVRVWNTTTGQSLRVVEGLAQPATAVAIGPQATRLAWGDAAGTLSEQKLADGTGTLSIGAHSAAVTGVVFDPAGKWMASSGAEGLVKIWNLPLAAPKTSTPLPAVPEFCSALTGDQVVIASGAGEPYVYDLTKGQVVRKLAGLVQPASALAVRADGSLVALGSQGGVVRFWNPTDGKVQGEIGGHEGAVTALALHPKEPGLATSSSDGLIRVWRAPELPVAIESRPVAGGGVVAAKPIAASPDGLQIAVGRPDGTVQLYRDATLLAAKKVKGAAAAISSVAMRRDGQEVAAGDQHGRVFAWNVAEGTAAGDVYAHDGPITGVHYSATGDRLLTSGGDGLVRFWQTPLAASQSLGKDAGPVAGLAISQDGSRAYLVTADRKLRALDATSGLESYVIAKWPAVPTSVALTPASDLVAIGDDTGMIRLRTAVDGAARAAFGGHSGAVRAMSFNPKKPQIATAGDDGKVRLWELPPPATALSGHQAKIAALALSPNGQQVATVAADKTARIWNIGTGNVAWLLGDSADVTCVAWKADGTQVATGNSAKQVRVWNVADGQQLALLEGHAAPLTQLAFLPDGSLASASADGQLKFWNLVEKKETSSLAAHAKPVVGLAIVPGTMNLASVGADGSLKIWNLAEKKSTLDLPGMAGATCLAASADGKLLALGGTDKSVRLLATVGGAVVQTLAGARDAIVAVAFAPDSQRIAAASMDGDVRVSTVAGAFQESASIQPALPTSVAFAPDGKGLVLGGSDQQLHQVRLAWQKTLDISQQPLASIGFLPDGDSLLVGGRDKLVTVWNVTAGNAVRNLPGPTGPIAAVAVSPDGTKLAATGADKTVRVWNAADGAVVATVTLPVAARDVEFSRDGMKLAVGCDEGSVRVLEAATGRMWQRWQQHRQAIVAVAWGTDPRLVFAASEDGHASRLAISTAAVLAPDGGARGAVLFPNAQSLVTWNAEKVGRLWTVTGQAGPQLAGAEGPLVSIAVRSDGVQLAGISADKHLYFWLAGNGQLERKVPLGVVPTHVGYSTDNTRVAVSCEDGGVRMVQVADGRILEVISAAVAASASTAILVPTPPQPNQPPPVERLVVSSADGQVEVRHPALVRIIAGHQGAVVELAWTPDGASLFSSGADKTVRQWLVANGQAVRTLGGPTDVVTGLAVVAGGTRVVGASIDKSLRWWNAADGALVATAVLPVPFRKLGATRDDSAVFTTSDDSVVRLWDATNGKELERITLAPPGVAAVAAGPGRTVIAAAADKTLRTWQPSLARSIVADAVAVQSLAVTPDGQHLVTSGNDLLVKQWDRDGKLVRPFAGSPAAWRHVFVTPDGATLVAGGDLARQQPSILRWKLADGAPLPTIAVPSPIVGLGVVGNGQVGAVSADGKLRMYATSDARLAEEILTPAGTHSLALTSDAKSIAVAAADGAVTGLVPNLTTLLLGHEGAVAGIVWSPDGKELVSAGVDKSIRRWDVATGKVVGSFAGSVAAVTNLAMSRDGRTLAASTADNIVRIWPVAMRPADGVLNDVPARLSLAAAPAVVRVVRLNADGSRLAIAGDDAQVHLWDTSLGKELERLAGHTAGIYSVALSDDGQQVLTASADRTTRRFIPSIRSVVAAHEGAILDAKFSADGQHIVTASADKRVRSWTSADLRAAQNFDGSIAAVRSVAWSADAGLVVAGGEDQTLRVWQVPDGKLLTELKLSAAITSVAVGQGAQRIVVGTADAIVRTFSLNSAAGKPQLELLHEGHGHTGSVVRVALSSDERIATSLGTDQIVRRWVAAGPSALAVLSGNEQAAYGLAFHPDGQMLASVGGDRSVRAWKLPGGEPQFVGREHSAAVNAIAFHAGGKQFATASADGSVRLWDEAGKPAARISVGITGRVHTLAYSPDGNAVVVGGTSRAVQTFHRESLLGMRTVDGHNQTIYQLTYNKTGTRLATLDYSGQLFVWDAAAGTPLFHQQLPVAVATGLAYSPDGVELAIASRDPRVIRVVIPPAAR